jgi:hypothetical protein
MGLRFAVDATSRLVNYLGKGEVKAVPSGNIERGFVADMRRLGKGFGYLAREFAGGEG